MSSHILFVFEGEKTEQNITNSLSKFFIQEPDKALIRASYGSNIYKLWKELKKDLDQDLLELLKIEIRKRDKISEHDQAILDIDDSDTISDIYLFFDYDCHCGNADDNKLSEMLSIFNDSMDQGLLCISYPMVESIKHSLLNNNNTPKTHPITDLTKYKSFVNQITNADIRYQNWGLYDLKIWQEIIEINLQRANFLVDDLWDLPTTPIGQEILFEAQLSKHVPNNEVAVISAFPMMLHDYYGSKLIDTLT